MPRSGLCHRLVALPSTHVEPWSGGLQRTRTHFHQFSQAQVFLNFAIPKNTYIGFRLNGLQGGAEVDISCPPFCSISC